MIHGHIGVPGTFNELLTHLAWKEAFAWVRRPEIKTLAPGTYEIAGRDLRAIVHYNETRNRNQLHFESHRREIDLQFCFNGCEQIEWAPAQALLVHEKYNEEKDVTLYRETLVSSSTLFMLPGMFAIFFPDDAHMPGIMPPHCARFVDKVVIKINKDLLAGKPMVLGPYEATFDYSNGVDRTMELITRPLLVPEGVRFHCINYKGIRGVIDGLYFSKKRGLQKKYISLVNLGPPVHHNNAPGELRKLGYQSVDPEWVWALHADHPTLMNDHIIISTKTDYLGPEGVPEVICLHNDDGTRRLRTHFSKTTWGSHIWFAVEKISA